MPRTLDAFVGNVRPLHQVREWMETFSRGTSSTPILMLYGPCGVGKTTLAHALFKTYGYHPYELNAGVIRSKKRIRELMEKMLGHTPMTALNPDTKTIGLIMDEIDGMSCGDKGGLHQLFNMIQERSVNGGVCNPIICISNTTCEMKVSETLFVSVYMKRQRMSELLQHLRFICEREDMVITDETLVALCKHCMCDLRKCISMLQCVYVRHNGVVAYPRDPVSSDVLQNNGGGCEDEDDKDEGDRDDKDEGDRDDKDEGDRDDKDEDDRDDKDEDDKDEDDMFCECTNVNDQELSIVRDLLSQTDVDVNIFDITHMTFTKQLSPDMMYQHFQTDVNLLPLMIHENMPSQLASKRVTTDQAVEAFINISHNLIITDAITTDVVSESNLSKAMTSCAYTNVIMSGMPMKRSVSPKIQFTNVLTKSATKSNLNHFLINLSYHVHVPTFHAIHHVAYVIHHILIDNHSPILKYNHTYSDVEKFIQLYQRLATFLKRPLRITNKQKRMLKRVLGGSSTSK